MRSNLENDENVPVDGYLEELMTILPTLQHDTHVSLQTFFANVEVDENIIYHEDQDSFMLQIKMRYLLTDDLRVDKAKARMVPVAGGQGRDIWLETEEMVVIKNGITRLQFRSNVSCPPILIERRTKTTKAIIPGRMWSSRSC